MLITGRQSYLQLMVLKEEIVLGQPDKALPQTLAAEAAHPGGHLLKQQSKSWQDI